MIAWDTNFLVRYLITQDDPEQSEIVLENLTAQQAKGHPIFLSSIVLCEAVWVMKAAYKLRRQAIVTILRHLLDDANFIFEHPERAHAALEMYAAQKGDYSDYLIGLAAHDTEPESNTRTFDKALKSSHLFQVHYARR